MDMINEVFNGLKERYLAHADLSIGLATAKRLKKKIEWVPSQKDGISRIVDFLQEVAASEQVCRDKKIFGSHFKRGSNAQVFLRDLDLFFQKFGIQSGWGHEKSSPYFSPMNVYVPVNGITEFKIEENRVHTLISRKHSGHTYEYEVIDNQVVLPFMIEGYCVLSEILSNYEIALV